MIAVTILYVPVAASAVEARASDLIGMEVVAANGERLGAVGEIVFDSRTGALRYYEVEHGGWLGLGARAAAIAPGMLSLRDRRLLFEGARSVLQTSPQPEPVTWPDIRAGDLVHREVQDRLHRDTGEVVDLAVSVDRARVTVAILDLRDDWQVGRRLARVPIEEFALPRDMGRFAVLDIDRERVLERSD